MPRKIKYDLLTIHNTETIGQRIAEYRNNLGLSQQELADKIGVKRYIIANYEQGRARVYDNMLKSLSIALNVTSDQLLGLNQKKGK